MAEQPTKHDEANLHEPLLAEPQENAAEEQAEDDLGGFGITTAANNLRQMGTMFVQLLFNQLCAYGINIVTLSYVGHLGKAELAAAALGMSLVGMLGRTVLYGMVGGLDTLASQAYGAGNFEAIGLHFRTAVAFLLLHSGPLFVLLAAVPMLLTEETSNSDLGVMAGRYVRFMLPFLFSECLNRPLNSVLLAQRITRPQMIIQAIALGLHVGTNYGLIHVAGLGYLGGAIATWCTAGCVTFMMSGYVMYTGLGPRVWGDRKLQLPTWQDLKALARLSYPACVMRCAESWGFSFMTVAAGKLPERETAVAVTSVSFNIYGLLFMGFVAFSMTVSTRIGNSLGSGSARRARHAALTALLAAPLMWLAVAMVLVEPHSQRWLALIFTNGKDAALMHHLRRMLVVVAVLELFDGSQAVMTGVIQGAGKQRLGVLVNVFAFYVVAIPTALVLGFVFQLGPEGMYSGMVLGPAIQAAAYTTIIFRLDWREEAKRVMARAAASDGPRSRRADGSGEQQ